MVDASSEQPHEPTGYERWRAELDQFDRLQRLREREFELRRQMERWRLLLLALGAAVLLAVVLSVVIWAFRAPTRVSPDDFVRIMKGERAAGDLPPQALPQAEREALARLRIGLAVSGTSPGAALTRDALVELLKAGEGAAKIPEHTANKLADAILDGAKEITVHGLEKVIDKLLGEDAGSITVTQVCAPTQTNIENPPKPGGGGGGGGGGRGGTSHHSSNSKTPRRCLSWSDPVTRIGPLETPVRR